MITTTKRFVLLVMLLIDTSVWIDVFRDRTGETKVHLAALIGEQDFALTRLIQIELLQGSRNEQEWSLLQSYLEGQTYLELNVNAWEAVARIFYDLRRQGLTVRSTINCCIAQAAIDHQAVLIHNDRDFEAIAQVRSLQHLRFHA
jgi:predicted nucleic acid-binding protein